VRDRPDNRMARGSSPWSLFPQQLTVAQRRGRMVRPRARDRLGLAALGRPAYPTRDELGAGRIIEDLNRRTGVFPDAAYGAGVPVVIKKSLANAGAGP